MTKINTNMPHGWSNTSNSSRQKGSPKKDLPAPVLTGNPLPS